MLFIKIIVTIGKTINYLRHENTTQHTNGVVHCLHLSVVAISFLLLHISGATAQINPGYFGTWVNTT
ncbi:MAG: hypothetical protein H7331_06070, partial [Bacteroidia bacterium]|nr:hypothetical protein [Bacteroidia bacterium]